MQDEGILKDEHASLAKSICTMRTHDVVSRAREVMGKWPCWNMMLLALILMPKLFIL